MCVCVLGFRFVEVCIFFVCVFFLRSQVAAVYKDPSVGNLINIVIVKLIVVHNEQVGGWGGTQVPLVDTGGLVSPSLSHLAGAGEPAGGIAVLCWVLIKPMDSLANVKIFKWDLSDIFLFISF